MKGSVVHPALPLILLLAQTWYSVSGCSPNPCLNSGSCIGNSTTFVCDCPDGFTGQLCETNINDCSDDSCSNRGACIDGVNDFSCLCQDGCTGDTCDTCTNPPEDPSCNPCDNGGTQVGETCYCAAGFTGDTCSDVTCGAPPSYPYATRTSTGSLVGDTATFECPTDFVQCVDPAVATCQASGVWTSLPNVCDRSSYTDLSAGIFYPTPCQPSSYLRLEMEVDLTGYSSSLQVRRGADILYMIQFWYGWRWYTYFSTNINGNINYVRYYHHPLNLSYNSNQVTITLNNGNYIMDANGYRVVRPDITGDAPQAFRFTGTINVFSLKMYHSP